MSSTVAGLLGLVVGFFCEQIMFRRRIRKPLVQIVRQLSAARKLRHEQSRADGRISPRDREALEYLDSSLQQLDQLLEQLQK